MKKFFKLYPDIIINHGAKMSIMIDFRLSKYFHIEKDLAEFISRDNIEIDTLSKDELEMIDYLVENDYGIIDSKEVLSSFEDIKLNWDYPAKISNAILEISENQSFLEDVIKQLSDLNCQVIELRFEKDVEERRLNNVLKYLGSNDIPSVELIIPQNHFINRLFIEKVVKEFNVLISKITFFNSEDQKNESWPRTNVKWIAGKLNCLDCGNVKKEKFAISLPFYTESLIHNTCLNRKISIDSKGFIKNCPSFQTTFGNVNDTIIENIIEDPSFKKSWNIAKNAIKVCQDCEFRHICSDCRAFTEKPEDDLSKPLKCGYDPYNGTWNEWTDLSKNLEVFQFYKKKLTSK